MCTHQPFQEVSGPAHRAHVATKADLGQRVSRGIDSKSHRLMRKESVASARFQPRRDDCKTIPLHFRPGHAPTCEAGQAGSGLPRPPAASPSRPPTMRPARSSAALSPTRATLAMPVQAPSPTQPTGSTSTPASARRALATTARATSPRTEPAASPTMWRTGYSPRPAGRRTSR